MTDRRETRRAAMTAQPMLVLFCDPCRAGFYEQCEGGRCHTRKYDSGLPPEVARTRRVMVDLALNAAFPGLPDNISLDEARRRVAAGLVAVGALPAEETQ